MYNTNKYFYYTRRRIMTINILLYKKTYNENKYFCYTIRRINKNICFHYTRRRILLYGYL